MHKPDIIKALVQSTKLSNKNVETVIESFMDVIKASLKKGIAVKLIGFGTFKTIKVKARIGRNPKTGKELKIPAKRRAKFTPGSKLKEAVE